jgi:general secretion pathway protein D
VFLRPVIMRDTETTNRVSMDRYDLIRGAQQNAQPKASILVPINESPVLPPMHGVEGTTQPLSPPPSSPGVTSSVPPAAPSAPPFPRDPTD